VVIILSGQIPDQPQSALAGFEPRIGLVDHVGPATTTDNPTVTVTVF